jgi:hypothetical protein
LVRVTISVQVLKTDGSQKYTQLAVSAVEEALSSQLNQRLFFFLLFLKGGNVLHELPTRTPPTIQGKHQMKKRKKNNIFRPEWYIFPPFHLLPRLLRTKTMRHRHLAAKLPTRSIFFATVKKFQKNVNNFLVNNSFFLSPTKL